MQDGHMHDGVSAEGHMHDVTTVMHVTCMTRKLCSEMECCAVFGAANCAAIDRS